MKKTKIGKSLFIASILLIASVLLFSFGKGPKAASYKIETKDWNTIDPYLKNYVSSLQDYAAQLEAKGLLSEYQYKDLVENLDEAYSEMKKSRTIYLPMGFGMGMGPLNGQGNGPKQQQGGQPGQPAQPGQPGNPGNPGNGQGYGPQQPANNLIKYSDFSKYIDSIVNSRTELQKSFVTVGLITQIQFDQMNTVEKNVYEQMKQNDSIPPFFGFQYLFMISGYDLDD